MTSSVRRGGVDDACDGALVVVVCACGRVLVVVGAALGLVLALGADDGATFALSSVNSIGAIVKACVGAGVALALALALAFAGTCAVLWNAR
jgi:hypothetical protein